MKTQAHGQLHAESKHRSRMTRRIRRALWAVAAAVGLLGAASQARASVSLVLTDNDATPQAVTVQAGQSYNVTLNVVSTSEKLTGVDYFFQVDSAAAGKMSITQRNTSASQFSDPLILDSQAAGAILGPGQSSTDMGATVTNVSNALTAGTYLLGQYTINVDPSITPGTYTLSTFALPGSGVVMEAPFFNEKSFDNQAAFTVTVTPAVSAPEPAAGATVLIGLAGMMLRRRKR
jgi:hypothetical protein